MTVQSVPIGPSQRLDVFRSLPPVSIERLLEGARLFQHRNRQPCFQAGEEATHFALVVSGCYKLMKASPKGAETLLSFATVGEPMGLLMMAPEKAQYPVTAQALGASSVFWIPRETYLNYWIHEPEVVRAMHHKLMTRCHGFHSDRSLQHLPLRARIAGFLLRCLDSQGAESSDVLRYPLTRREISEAVGAQPESVIRVMSTWQKDRWISTQSRQIQILRPDKLVQLLKEPSEES